MASYGKIRLRNLDDDILAYLKGLAKKGEISIADLSEDLRERIERLNLAIRDENVIYVDYDDSKLKTEIQELRESMLTQDSAENFRDKDKKITAEDLDTSLLESLSSGGNLDLEALVPVMENIRENAAAITSLQDAVAKLEDDGPTRSILKHLYIARTPDEEEFYKAAKLSPIYKASSGKVFVLHYKTNEEAYLEEGEEQDGAEASGLDVAEGVSLDSDTDVIEIPNDESAPRRIFVGGSDPEDAKAGDLWFDLSEAGADEEYEEDSIYDEWDISGETWEEVPGGLLDRNYARCLIYDPIRHHIYYCTYGKLMRIQISPDYHTKDISLSTSESVEVEIGDAHNRIIQVLVLGDDGFYRQATGEDCELRFSERYARIKNVSGYAINVRLVY